MSDKVFLKAGEKYIWDITREECDYIYGKLHMDNYVYAGYSTLINESYPANLHIEPRYENIPYFFHNIYKKYCDLSLDLNRGQARDIRIRSNCLSLRMYERLKETTYKDINTVIKALAALAYIPLTADKNDDVLLWKHPVIRLPEKSCKNFFSHLLVETSLEKLLENENFSMGAMESSPHASLFLFAAHATQCIIIMIENGHCYKEIEKAYHNMEKTILKYEYKNDIGNKNKFLNNIKYPGQIRYRNTLYLYGGNFFERNGHFKKAFQWYTKDIYSFDILKNEDYFLTMLKTCERFLCAYRVAPKIGEETDILLEILNNYLLNTFTEAAKYAKCLNSYIKRHPGIDLSGMIIPADPDDSFYCCEQGYLFGGEAANEIFIFALLYNKIVLNRDYRDINYNDSFNKLR